MGNSFGAKVAWEMLAPGRDLEPERRGMELRAKPETTELAILYIRINVLSLRSLASQLSKEALEGLFATS